MGAENEKVGRSNEVPPGAKRVLLRGRRVNYVVRPTVIDPGLPPPETSLIMPEEKKEGPVRRTRPTHTSPNFHPWQCNGPGGCFHCDGEKTDLHNPSTCMLCLDKSLGPRPPARAQSSSDGVVLIVLVTAIVAASLGFLAFW